MARITLQFDKKDVFNREGKHSFTTGKCNVKLFDNDGNKDGIELEVFEHLINQRGNWTILHKRFQATDGHWQEAREAYYDEGQIAVRDIVDGTTRIYKIDDLLIQSFKTVISQTMINLRELEVRRQSVKEEYARDKRYSITNDMTGTNG